MWISENKLVNLTPEIELDEDAKTGMLDSQAPRMKKQVIANQHIVAITPHCLFDSWKKLGLAVDGGGSTDI